MISGQSHLFIPGPTNVPECVRQAMNVPMQDMRAPDFGNLTLRLAADLKPIFGSRTADIFLWPGSGTAAWEAAMTNTLSPGDKVVMLCNGHFSTLWVQMADRLGFDVEVVETDWGEAASVEGLSRVLGRDIRDEIKAVFVTHNETSTGVTSDIAAVRHAMDMAFHDALLFVDGVSSIGSIRFEMDAWGVDLAVAGSQKGLMCPPGLGILAVSEKAMELSRHASSRRAYFEFADMQRHNANGQFPYTPPIPLLHGLKAALQRLHAEGLDTVFARHARLAEGIRRGVAAWGCKTVARGSYIASDTVTAIEMPEGVDASDVLRIAYEDLGTSFGGGLGPLDGRAFRIGHLGDLNEGMCLTALGLAEMAMVRAGADLRMGAGVAAAQNFYTDTAPAPARAPETPAWHELRLAAE